MHKFGVLSAIGLAVFLAGCQTATQSGSASTDVAAQAAPTPSFTESSVNPGPIGTLAGFLTPSPLQFDDGSVGDFSTGGTYTIRGGDAAQAGTWAENIDGTASLSPIGGERAVFQIVVTDGRKGLQYFSGVNAGQTIFYR